MDVLTPVPGWSCDVETDGVGVLWIDTPKSKLNILSQAMFEGLDRMLTEVTGRGELRALVLISRKSSGFVVGADIDMFADIKTAEEGQKGSAQAQRILSRVAELRVPTVAAIHGACLGGGLELALCATKRIASDSAETVLALPEVQLGLLPGAGGTQRLPRLIGLRAALDMILTGKRVRAQSARKLGLVDEVVPVEILLERARTVAREMANRPPGLRPGKTLGSLLIEATMAGRAVVYQKAEQKVLQTTQGNYPAPLLALEAVRRGYRRPLDEGLEAEARLFGELVVSAQSRNLIHLFKATTALKADPLPDTPVAVDKIGVLGGGLMGSGIATVGVEAGYRVRVKDRDWATLGKTLAYVRRYIEDRGRKRRQRAAEINMQMARVSVTPDLSGFKSAQLVIEAVFEDLGVKRQVVKEVEQVCDARTVFASNTSSLSIASIAEASQHPETIVGMHFFSPVEKMPLLEVITTEKTAPWATATAVQVGRKMGKHVIVVKNKEGFYTTRVLGPYLVEAIWLLHDGVGIQEIDTAMARFGFPLGPLALMDEVGIDVGAKVMQILQGAFGERFNMPEGISKLFKSDRLGKKNGKGFYLYPSEGGKKKPGQQRAVDPTIRELLPPTTSATLIGEAEIQLRCSLVFLNEAVRCLEEGVLASARDGDVGAVFGLGFPPFRGGPFRYLDYITPAAAVRQLERLEKTHGMRFRPAPRLVEMAEKHQTFY